MSKSCPSPHAEGKSRRRICPLNLRVINLANNARGISVAQTERASIEPETTTEWKKKRPKTKESTRCRRQAHEHRIWIVRYTFPRTVYISISFFSFLVFPLFLLFTARCYASAVLAMGLCPCLCLSVTSRCSTKTAKRRITQTTPHDTSGTLVFWYQRSPRNLTGLTPYEGAECRWGGSKSATFDKYPAISRKR